MARARRLLWLSAFAGIVYVIWRWRNQQADAANLPAYAPPPSTLPVSAPPAPDLPGPGLAAPAADAAPRRIVTRVHRGAPPSRGADEPPAEPDPDVPPEPEAPPAAVALEAAVGATPPQAAVEPEPEPAAPEEGGVDLAPLIGPDAAGDAVDLAPLVGPAAALGEAAIPGALVNLNTADHEALVALPGIGPALARRIIAYREQYGPFGSVEQLIDVQGIGTRNIDEFRHLVTV